MNERMMIVSAKRLHTGNQKSTAKILLACLLMSLIISAPVYADGTSQELRLTDEVFTVIVTASRIPQIITETPASVVVITKEQLEQTGVNSVGEALKTSAGVYIKDNGTVGSPASILIRGSSNEQTLVLLNGRPLNDARTGGIDAASIPVSGIERIEVIKGAASALYGADAVAGVVNIITAAGQGKPNHTLRADVGEYGTRSLTFTSTGSSGATGYSLTAANLSTEGFRKHSSYEKLDFHLRLDQDLSPREQVSMGVRHSGYGVEVPEDLTWPGSEGWRDGKNTSLDLQYSRLLNLSSDLTLRTYYDDTQMQYRSTFENSLHKGKRTGWDLQVNTAPAGSQHLFTYGIMGEKDWVDSTSFSQAKERTSWGIYAQDILSLTSRFDVVFSGRYDQFSSHGDSLCGRIGLNYLLRDRSKVYASWGNAFRAPTLNELYWDFMGNPDLKPETAQNYELGWQHWANDSSSFSAAVFHRDVSDMIAWAPVDPSGDIWRAMNVNTVKVQGVELETAYQLTAQLAALLNYTYLDAVKNQNQPLDYTPAHKAQAGLTYTSERGFSGTVEVLYVGDRPAGGGQIPAYTVTNLNLSQKMGQGWQVHCRVNNVFDTEYLDTPGFPAPPRMITAGVSYSF
jgi:outer membrane cobalamin receptor